jgi:acyl-coenzyme A thioesterase PaaI-like protein
VSTDNLTELRRAGDPVEPAGQTLALPWGVLPDYRCFGCSPHNEHGLRLSFQVYPDRLECRLQAGPEFESYPGVVHGGVTTAALDEIMGNLLVLRTGRSVFTTTLRLRYVSPLSVGEAYTCVARCDLAPGTELPDDSRPVPASAEVLDAEGRLLVSATASYQPVTMAQARERMTMTEEEAGAVGRALAEFSRNPWGDLTTAPASTTHETPRTHASHEPDQPYEGESR